MKGFYRAEVNVIKLLTTAELLANSGTEEGRAKYLRFKEVLEVLK